MKAVVVEEYTSIDSVRLKEVAKPDISTGQARVRVQAVGIGFVDGLKMQGRYQIRDPLPFTPGSEFAGVVDEIAPGVMGLTPGMPVVGMAQSGALAEYVTVPAAFLQPMSADIAPEVGASFRTNYLTALYALSERGSIRAGEVLLVLGAAGGVGVAAVQIGKLLGARVIAAASTEEKRAFASRYGADATLDYTRPEWRDELKALTNNQGADVIFDPVGGDITVQAFRSIAWRGRHLIVGFAEGGIPSLPVNLALLKGGALLGVDLAQVARREPEIQNRLVSQLLRWLVDKKFVPAIGRVVDFEDFREAFMTIQARAATGKMVVRIG